MSLLDCLVIAFLTLTPIVIIMFGVQEKLLEIDFAKYYDGKFNKILITSCIIWCLIGLMIIVPGALKALRGSDAWGLIVLVVIVVAISFGIEFLSLGIAKLIDKFSKDNSIDR